MKNEELSIIKMFAALHIRWVRLSAHIHCTINNEKGLRCLLYPAYFSKWLVIGHLFTIFVVSILPSCLQRSFLK